MWQIIGIKNLKEKQIRVENNLNWYINRKLDFFCYFYGILFTQNSEMKNYSNKCQVTIINH